MDHSLKSLSNKFIAKVILFTKTILEDVRFYAFNHLKLLLMNLYVWLVLLQNSFRFVVSIILKTTSTLPFKNVFGEKKN